MPKEEQTRLREILKNIWSASTGLVLNIAADASEESIRGGNPVIEAEHVERLKDAAELLSVLQRLSKNILK